MFPCPPLPVARCPSKSSQLRLARRRCRHYAVPVVAKRFAFVHNLITVQPPRSTRSSSLVTLARPSTSSSARITYRSFQYASPRLWNQLLSPLRQPGTNLSNSASPSSLSGNSSISFIDSPLSSSVTPVLFHFRLKTFFFCRSFSP